MLVQISENELSILFMLTIILIVIKGLLVSFLGFKMYQRKKETGEFTYGFVFGVFVLMICLLVSRIFYSIFDFYLTKFDPTIYYLMPNVLFWKLGSFASTVGYSVFIFKTDQKALDFRFKGIISYVMIALGVFQLVYPVNTAEDFYFINTLNVFLNVTAIIIPIIFFTLGWKPTPYRVASLSIAVGTILYAIGANITMEFVMSALESAFGYSIRIWMFLLSLIFKASGLIMFSIGMSEFAIKFSK